MTLKKLIDKYETDLVMIRFAELYKEEIEKSIKPFQMVYDHLKGMKAIPQDEYTLIVEKVADLIDKDITFNDVSAIDEKTKTRVGLDFYEWEHWLACPISEKTLQEYTELDVICHCLWEMTFYGFEEDKIKEIKDELERRVKSIDDGTAKFVDWKTVCQKIGLDQELEAWEKASDESSENLEKKD